MTANSTPTTSDTPPYKTNTLHVYNTPEDFVNVLSDTETYDDTHQPNIQNLQNSTTAENIPLAASTTTRSTTENSIQIDSDDNTQEIDKKADTNITINLEILQNPIIEDKDNQQNDKNTDFQLKPSKKDSLINRDIRYSITSASESSIISTDLKTHDSSTTALNVYQSLISNNFKVASGSVSLEVQSDNINLPICSDIAFRNAFSITLNSTISEPSPEPTTNETLPMKASVICTWVPKKQTGNELTVIAGDIITVVDSPVIDLQYTDNPLAVIQQSYDDGDGNTPTGTSYIVTLNSIHWTLVRGRSSKQGVVPSNILRFDSNPINNVWTKVKMSFLYSAKCDEELSVFQGEDIFIYGCVNADEMIVARVKSKREGLIPFNFVEIPGVNKNMRPSLSSTQYNSNVHTPIILPINSRSSVSQQMKSLNMNYTADDSGDYKFNDVFKYEHENNSPHVIPKKKTSFKLTSKVQAISALMSTAVDKLQAQIFQDGNVADITPVDSNMSNGTIDSVNDNGVSLNAQQMSYRGFNSGPVKWTSVFVVKSFDASYADINEVYASYIKKKTRSGRVDSILIYDETEITPEAARLAKIEEDNIEWVAAMPSMKKYAPKDCIAISNIDSIEICGEPTPEGWIYARYCLPTDKEKKQGFVPMSALMFTNHIYSELPHATVENTFISSSTTVDHSLVNNEPNETLKIQLQISAETMSIDNIGDHSLTPSISSNNRLNHPPIDILKPVITSVHSSTSPIGILSKRRPLKFHWPFSSYLVEKRSLRSKSIETSVYIFFLIIFVLPVIIDDPEPDGQSSHFQLWFANLFGVVLPVFLLCLLRMLELWTKCFTMDNNPHNRLYGRCLFYILLIYSFCGLLAIMIELSEHEHILWIKENQPLLYFASVIEAMIFVGCCVLMLAMVLFAFVSIYCCRVSRNRWEYRIECYCCRKEAIVTKRFTILR